MKAVVMAGGEGSRLRPLTLHRPKPLVPVVNKPVMQHILELLEIQPPWPQQADLALTNCGKWG